MALRRQSSRHDDDVHVWGRYRERRLHDDQDERKNQRFRYYKWHTRVVGVGNRGMLSL